MKSILKKIQTDLNFIRKESKFFEKKYKGKIPKRLEELQELPGVGEYTANALLALVYNQPHIALDANLKRFLSIKLNLLGDVVIKLASVNWYFK